MAFLSRYIMPALIALSLAAGGSAFYLLKRNQALKADLVAEQAVSEGLRIARAKDAIAAKQLIEAMQAQQEMLAAQLQQLSEIDDEEGRTYLDAPVPDSVRRLFNSSP